MKPVSTILKGDRLEGHSESIIRGDEFDQSTLYASIEISQYYYSLIKRADRNSATGISFTQCFSICCSLSKLRSCIYTSNYL
jgi:hypothetical protein